MRVTAALAGLGVSKIEKVLMKRSVEIRESSNLEKDERYYLTIRR